MKLVCVVLAGGEGRRMGGVKASRVLGGRTLLERALERAKGYADEVAVAVREPLTAPVQTLLDDPALPGPLAGVASALAFAAERGAPAALTVPIDAPFMPDDLAARLAAALSGGVAVARSGGRLHPVCALWRTGLDAPLRTYAATGRGSLMGLADAVGWTAVDWPAEPLDPFLNINTPQDLARAEALLA